MQQLLELRKQNLGNAEEMLSSKGWELIRTTNEGDNKVASVTFAYNKSEMSDIAESFLTIFGNNRIHIQVNNINKYNEYLKAIKGYKAILISSEVDDGDLVKIYKGKTTTFKIWSGKSENFFKSETSNWHIAIFSNEDYLLNFQNTGTPFFSNDYPDEFYTSYEGLVTPQELEEKFNFVASENGFDFYVKLISQEYDSKSGDFIFLANVKKVDSNGNFYFFQTKIISGRKNNFYIIIDSTYYDNKGNKISKNINQNFSNDIIARIETFIIMNCECVG